MMTHAEMRALYADPVPAAGGEPEVVYMLSNKSLGTAWRMADKEAYDSMAMVPVYERRELVDRAHFTRLQAEVRQLRQHKNDYMEAAEETRKALQAEVELASDRAFRASEAHVITMGKLHTLQSELTKARELLRISLDLPFSIAHQRHIELFLSNQSAPADKGQV